MVQEKALRREARGAVGGPPGFVEGSLRGHETQAH